MEPLQGETLHYMYIEELLRKEDKVYIVGQGRSDHITMHNVVDGRRTYDYGQTYHSRWDCKLRRRVPSGSFFAIRRLCRRVRLLDRDNSKAEDERKL